MAVSIPVWLTEQIGSSPLRAVRCESGCWVCGVVVYYGVLHVVDRLQGDVYRRAQLVAEDVNGVTTF